MGEPTFQRLVDAPDILRIEPLAPDSIPAGVAHPKNKTVSLRHTTSALVCGLSGARIFGNPYLIFSRDRVHLSDLSEVGVNEILSWPAQWKDKIICRGRVLSLLTPCSGNFCHWLVDLLPKIDVISRSGWRCEDFDAIIVPSVAKEYEQRSLELVGLSKSQIVSLKDQPANAIRIEGLLFLVPQVHTHPLIRLRTLQWVRGKMTKDVLFKRKRRLFVDRNGASWRHLLNQHQVLPILERYGFERIRPETLGFDEARQVFAEAEVVVGLHGAGLTNLLFCPSGCSVLEIFAPEYTNPIYRLISKAGGLNYHVLFGEGSFPTGSYSHTFEKISKHVTVLPKEFEKALKALFD